MKIIHAKGKRRIIVEERDGLVHLGFYLPDDSVRWFTNWAHGRREPWPTGNFGKDADAIKTNMLRDFAEAVLKEGEGS